MLGVAVVGASVLAACSTAVMSGGGGEGAAGDPAALVVTTTVTAGEALGGHRAVRVGADGLAWLAEPDSTARLRGSERRSRSRRSAALQLAARTTRHSAIVRQR